MIRLRSTQEDLDRHLRSLQNEQSQYLRETGKLRGEVEEKTRLLHEMDSMLSTERTRSLLELSALRERLRKGKKGGLSSDSVNVPGTGIPSHSGVSSAPTVPGASNDDSTSNIPIIPNHPDTPNSTPSPKETPKSTPRPSGSFPSINATPIQRVPSPLSDTKSHGSSRKDSSLDTSSSVFTDAMSKVNETMNLLQQHNS